MNFEPPELIATITFGLVLGALLNAVAAALEALGTVGLVAVSETSTSLSSVARRVLDRGPRIRDSLLAMRVFCVASTSALSALEGHSLGGRTGAAIGVFSVALAYVMLAQIGASVARRRPSTVALHLLRLLRPFEWMLLPFVLPLGALRSLIERLVPQRDPPGTEPERLAEIAVEQVLEQSEAKGSIGEDQAELLWNVLEFRNTVAREIMVPRTRVVGFEVSSDARSVLASIRESQHSRYPVYRGSLDHVEGVLFAKDLFRAFERDEGVVVQLTEIMRKPVMFVEADAKIADVLRAMQRKRIHLAVVTDEFGGGAGIVTLEDIVEEIVGEIQDEHDDEEAPVRETRPGTILADASIGIYDLADRFGVELPTEEAEVDSLGGLVAHVAGRVPRVGESVAIGEFEVTVISGDRQRVSSVEIKRRSASSPPEAAQ